MKPYLFDTGCKMANEWCPHCETEVEIPSDKRSKCPVCNESIVPCSVCSGASDEEGDCDWEEGKGCSVFPL
jgi:hypothetical protein